MTATPRWTGPINSRTGMPIDRRSWGGPFDPESTQRRIGRSVYIFRRVPGGMDVWRLAGIAGLPEIGHHWTLEHAWRSESER